MHMFRPMLRPKQQLEREECLQLLEQAPRGVLSVVGDDGYPYGLPMNFWYCREDGRLYFHCGPAGHKLDALRRCDKAGFCVMDQGERKPGDWALTFRSVIVFGRVQQVKDREEAIRVTRLLSEKYTADTGYIDYEFSKYADSFVCFALTPEHISGKRVHEA